MLQPHERVALRRLAEQIEAHDPRFARRLTASAHHVSLRAATRCAVRALSVAAPVLVAAALLTVGLVHGGGAVTLAGAVVLCVALPVSLWIASCVNRTWRP